MPVVVGIRFKDSGKVYYFDPRDLDVRVGEHVIVETVRGLELARVAHERREVPEEEIIAELKPVVRRAEPADFERLRQLQSRHDEVLARCAEKVREHGLPMKLVKAEYSFDGSRLTFYFTAEKRVDFRMLVRDLARTFRTRIELRQIGPRDEAKLLGGIGPCGRILCCASFLPDYARVSIKMAKDQDLPLNPSKISGVCGRLLCCLSYEHEQYVTMRAELPRKGAWVQTPDGPGEVIAQLVLKQQLLVQLASSGMQEIYSLDQIEVSTAQVAALAQARNAEGITPAAQQRRSERDRGERRRLRDEIESYDAFDELDFLEDEDDAALIAPLTAAGAPPDEPVTEAESDDALEAPADAAPASSARRRRRRGGRSEPKPPE
ncbi:MAG: stage 0 sporulation family protein [Oscillochloridaceae bacterium]|nr:stage 0 sporulation family protein [Chloroflexaceae bacterium]MDW8390547.1 stage 0 sporulation family protein [Oscillochloridaceae bacterium]